MKKINVIILIYAVFLLFFSCSEPTENISSSAKDLKSYPVYSREFDTPGDYNWVVPEHEPGSVTVTIVGGGGGGGGSGAVLSGGGGGAGHAIIQNVKLTEGEIIQIRVGNGGKGGGSSDDGNNGQPSRIIANSGEFIAEAGSGGYWWGDSGSGYPSGKNGQGERGGSGGDNGRGHGQGNKYGDGAGAPANSGGGGGGAGNFISGYTGGRGGSGYVRIDYKVAKLPQ